MNIYQKNLNEEYNTDNGSRVFYVGTSSKSVDISNRDEKTGIIDPVKFADTGHSDISKLKISSSMYMSNTLQYALQYALIGQQETGTGVLMTVELPKGLRFFDVENVNDYHALGLDDDIAKIFMKMETYFINRSIELNKNKLRPRHFTQTFTMLNVELKRLGYNSKNFIDKLRSSEKSVTDIFNNLRHAFSANYYIKFYIERTFEYIFGKKDWQNLKEHYTTVDYGRSDMIEQVKNDLVSIGKGYKAQIKRSRGDKDKYNSGIFAANKDSGQDGIWSLICDTKITFYPKSLESNVLFRNYMNLFDSGTIEWVPADLNSSDFTKMMPYIKLLDLLQWTLKQNDGILINDPDLRFTIKRQARRESHMYVDSITWVFYYLLTHRLRNGHENPFVGIKTCERIGYLAVTKNPDQAPIGELDESKDKVIPYGYKRSELSPDFKNDADTTLIICKPLPLDRCKFFAHDLTFMFENDHIDGDMFRTIIDGYGSAKFNSVQQYKKMFTDILSYKDKKLVRLQQQTGDDYYSPKPKQVRIDRLSDKSRNHLADKNRNRLIDKLNKFSFQCLYVIHTPDAGNFIAQQKITLDQDNMNKIDKGTDANEVLQYDLKKKESFGYTYSVLWSCPELDYIKNKQVKDGEIQKIKRDYEIQEKSKAAAAEAAKAQKDAEAKKGPTKELFIEWCKQTRPAGYRVLFSPRNNDKCCAIDVMVDARTIKLDREKAKALAIRTAKDYLDKEHSGILLFQNKQIVASYHDTTAFPLTHPVLGYSVDGKTISDDKYVKLYETALIPKVINEKYEYPASVWNISGIHCNTDGGVWYGYIKIQNKFKFNGKLIIKGWL